MATFSQDIVVLCGGQGSRLGSLATEYGSKPFIPLAGIPIVEHVLRTVSGLTTGQLILCAEREELVARLDALVQHLSMGNIVLHKDNGLGARNALREVSSVAKTDSILMIYGHQLMRRAHLERLLGIPNGILVFSLYKTSSDDKRKIASFDEKGRCKYIRYGNEDSTLGDNEFYADAPYLLPRALIDNLLQGDVSWYEAFEEWLRAGMSVAGQETTMPHEFHYVEELGPLHDLATQLQQEN